MPDVPTPSDSPWVYLVGIAISGGFAKYLVDLWKEHVERQRNPPPASSRRQAEIDASLITLAKINDELESDNVRLRAMNADAVEQFAAVSQLLSTERADRRAERAAMQAEIHALELRVAEQGRAHRLVYDELLAQIRDLRKKHTGPIPVVPPPATA